MKRAKILSFLTLSGVLLMLSGIVKAQVDKPTMVGIVKEDGKPVYRALAKLIENGEQVDKTATNYSGKFTLTLEVGKNYIIEISKAGYVTQKISVQTNVPQQYVREGFFPFEFEVSMIKDMSGLNTSIFRKPVMKIKYSFSKRDFFIDENYEKYIKSDVLAVYRQLEGIKRQIFNDKIAEAKNLFTKQQYEDAWLLYDEAAKLMPGETGPKENINQIKELISRETPLEMAYYQHISEAESFFETDKQQAKKHYQLALLYKPEAQEPKQKIHEINEMLSDLSNMKRNAYESNIEKADELFNQKKYEEAREFYKEALDLIPDEQYPKNRIDEINTIIPPDGQEDSTFVDSLPVEEEKDLADLEQELKEKEKKGDKDGAAETLSDIGHVHYKEGDYDNSIDNFEKSAKIKEALGKDREAAIVYNNIGIIYDNIYKQDKAIDSYKKSLDLSQKAGDKGQESSQLNNIGNIYYQKKDFSKSIQYFKEALEVDKTSGNQKNEAVSYNNLGAVYYEMGNYNEAMNYYNQSLNIASESGDKKEMAEVFNNMGNVKYDQEQHDEAISYYNRSLKIKEETNYSAGIAISLHNIGNVYFDKKSYNKAIDCYTRSNEIARKINLQNVVFKNYNVLSKAYAEIKDFKNAFKFLKLFADQFTIASTDLNRQITELQQKFIMERNIRSLKEIKIKTLETEITRQDLLAKLQKEKAERDKALFREREKSHRIEIEKQAQIARIGKRLIFVLVLLAVSLIIIALSVYRNYRRKKVDHAIIAREKAKSDKLLHNVLPAKVANDLKETGTTIPQEFDDVSVFLSDIIGFTKISAQMEPGKVINELNQIFTRFDEIMEKHHCERIKTIGDAYLAVCGMPVSNPKHAENIANAALEIKEYLTERNKTEQVTFKMRIGINSGSVVGGVVGEKKYIYDVFGDTINTTQRMESTSEPMKINVSESTYQLLKDKFNFKKREPIEVHGKGILQMYFLNSVKSKRTYTREG